MILGFDEKLSVTISAKAYACPAFPTGLINRIAGDYLIRGHCDTIEVTEIGVKPGERAYRGLRELDRTMIETAAAGNVEVDRVMLRQVDDGIKRYGPDPHTA